MTGKFQLPLPLVFGATLALLLAAPAGAQAGALERIRERGVITLGYVDGAAPFSYADGNGEPQGYSVDLCRAVADGIRAQLKLGSLKTRWVKLTIQNRIEAVRRQRVDAECSTTTWTLGRQKLVDFSLITFVDGATVLARAQSSASRLADYEGKRIAVISGTTTEQVLRDALAQHQVHAQIVVVKTRDEGIGLLDQSKVDGFASDRTTLIGLVAKRGGGGVFKLLDEDYSVEPYALVLPRDDHDFRLAVNRTLARLYRTGEIRSIYDRWLGPLGPPSLLLSAGYYIQGLRE